LILLQIFHTQCYQLRLIQIPNIFLKIYNKSIYPFFLSPTIKRIENIGTLGILLCLLRCYPHLAPTENAHKKTPHISAQGARSSVFFCNAFYRCQTVPWIVRNFFPAELLARKGYKTGLLCNSACYCVTHLNYKGLHPTKALFCIIRLIQSNFSSSKGIRRTAVRRWVQLLFGKGSAHLALCQKVICTRKKSCFFPISSHFADRARTR